MSTSPTSVSRRSEFGVVGWALDHGKRSLDIELEHWHFEHPRLASAWKAIRSMAAAGDPVDAISVADRIEREETGLVVMPVLLEAMRDPAGWPELHEEKIRDAWVERKTFQAFIETHHAREQGILGPELLDEALRRLAEIDVAETGRSKSIGDLVRDRYRAIGELLDAQLRGEVATTGIHTGIRDLDALLGGIQLGICTVLAGRPGMGKSALGQTLCDNASAAEPVRR